MSLHGLLAILPLLLAGISMEHLINHLYTARNTPRFPVTCTYCKRQLCQAGLKRGIKAEEQLSLTCAFALVPFRGASATPANGWSHPWQPVMNGCIYTGYFNSLTLIQIEHGVNYNSVTWLLGFRLTTQPCLSWRGGGEQRRRAQVDSSLQS